MPRAPEPIDEIVDMPRERNGLPKVAVVLALVLVLFGGLVLGGRSWYQRQVDPPGPQGEPVDVVVPNGARLTDLGSILGDADVVANATIFRFWIRGKDIDLQAGTYRFRRNSSFEEVETVLRGDPLVVATTDLTIPEGFTIDQIAARIPDDVPRFTSEDVLLALADPANRSRFQPGDQPSMEGMLFPSTYEVGPQDTASTMVRRMVDEMDQQATEAGIDLGLTGDRLPSLDAYQIITVASLIERESGNPAGVAPHRAGHLQPAARGHPPRHRRDQRLRGREERHRDRLREPVAVQHPHQRGPAADPDRGAQPGLPRRRPEPGDGPGAVLRARGRGPALLHRRLRRVPGQEGRVRGQGAGVRLTAPRGRAAR